MNVIVDSLRFFAPLYIIVFSRLLPLRTTTSTQSIRRRARCEKRVPVYTPKVMRASLLCYKRAKSYNILKTAGLIEKITQRAISRASVCSRSRFHFFLSFSTQLDLKRNMLLLLLLLSRLETRLRFNQTLNVLLRWTARKQRWWWCWKVFKVWVNCSMWEEMRESKRFFFRHS